MKLKKQFINSDKISTNYSQSGQDLFVLMISNGKKNGTFIEIGSHEPIYINNTYLLEKQFNWSGHLIEIDTILCEKCKTERTSNVICADAVKVDYIPLYNNFIDYLSIDIDGINSLLVLEKLPINLNNTGIITFEHDSYRFNDEIKIKSREFFENAGFYRLCSDVCNENNPFEDWYINPIIYSINNFKELESINLNWDKIIYI